MLRLPRKLCGASRLAENVCHRRGAEKMRFDQLPRSNQIEDRRGDTPRGFPIGRVSGIGIGTLLLLTAISWVLGINPLYLISGAELLSGLRGQQQQTQPTNPPNPGSDRMGEFVAAVLGSTEAQWKDIFAQGGKNYQADQY